MDLASVINASAMVSVACSIVYKVYTETREYGKKKVLDYAVALVEEGISYSEEKNKFLKREAAANAGKALQKQPVEVTKDQIAIDKFFVTAMAPIREIAHNNAKEYILNSIKNLKDQKMKKAVEKIFSESVDSAIKMRICGAKMNIQESIRPLLYRSL